MSNGINHVTLFGNLGAAPELRVTSGGSPLLKLRVATNDAYYDKEKNLIERTDWHDVVMFGVRAEPLSRILNKGDSVVVEGAIRYSSYEKEGVTRYRTEIVAKDLCLAGRRRSSGMPELSGGSDEEPYAPDTAAGGAAAAAVTAADMAADADTVSEPSGAMPIASETPAKRRRNRFDSNGAGAHTEEVTA